MPAKRIRTRALAAAASLAVVAGLFALAPLTGVASSHREAPLVSADPRIDTTDVWAFVSEDRPDTVTLIASWIPFEEPAGGPNFYAWGNGVHYDLNIDNDYDAKPDVTYRWVFSSRYRNPRARDAVTRRVSGRTARLVPVLSAASIALLGMVLTFRGFGQI